ncbi:MAG: acyl--CoA ligase, partial [Limnohabitans sp.]|nr:acyl--CoA ligase [Limnohabitans sp.]
MFSDETSPLAARFAQLAQDCGTQPAMTFRGDERKATQTGDSTFAYDFAKFWRRVERVTAHLQSTWGVQPGDRVAWLGFNHELQLVMLVACARLGAVFLPLNFRLAVPELQQVMQDAQSRLLVHDTHHADTARALQGADLQHTHHDTLIATASPRALLLPAVYGELPLLLVYTSGTTGVPKG